MNGTITLDITLNGETRSVEFTQVRDDLASSVAVFAARIGDGVKMHRTHAVAWKRDGVWTFDTNANVLNRAARITNWADAVQYAKSEHSGSRI